MTIEGFVTLEDVLAEFKDMQAAKAYGSVKITFYGGRMSRLVTERSKQRRPEGANKQSLETGLTKA